MKRGYKEVIFCQFCGKELSRVCKIELDGKDFIVCMDCYSDITPILEELDEVKRDVEKFYYNLILRLIKSSRKGR